MSRSAMFFRNLMSNWTGMLIGLMIAFFMSPFVVRKLGNTYYGVWNIVMDMTGYLGLLEMGVRQTVIRYVAKYYGEKDSESLNLFVSASFSIYCFTSLACVFISIGLAALFPYIFKVSPETVPVARFIVVITGLNIAQGLIFSVYYGVILGIQRYYVMNRIGILFSVVKAGITVVLLENGFGIVGLSLLHLAMNLTSSVYGMQYCKKEIPALKIRFGLYGREVYGKIFNYSIKTFLMFIGSKIIFYSDSIVIGMILGPAQVTFFAIGALLTEHMRRIISQMTQLFVPLTSELHARKEEEKISFVLIQGTKLSLIVALPISIVLLSMGKRFISLWMGKEYGNLSGDVLMILTIAHLFSVAQYTTQEILQGMNKHQICAVSRGIEAIANLTLSIILIKYYGIVGVAIGTAIPHLVTAIVAYPYFISKYVKVDFKQYVVHSYIYPMLASVPFFYCCLWIESHYPAAALPGFFLRVLLLMPIYLIFAWYVSLGKQDRIVYTEALYKMIPALNKK